MPEVIIDNYNGQNVFVMRPNWIHEPNQNLENLFEVFQAMGRSISRSSMQWVLNRFKFRYMFETKEYIFDMKESFDGKIGRYGHFWIPSWRQDINVTATFGAADDFVTIEDIDYANYWLTRRVEGRHLFFDFPDGTRVYRSVIAAPASTVLTLGSAIGKAIAAAELPHLSVSFLHFVRFDSDQLKLTYYNDGVAISDLSFKEIPFEILSTTTTTTSTTSTTTTSSTTTTT